MNANASIDLRFIATVKVRYRPGKKPLPAQTPPRVRGPCPATQEMQYPGTRRVCFSHPLRSACPMKIMNAVINRCIFAALETIVFIQGRLRHSW